MNNNLRFWFFLSVCLLSTGLHAGQRWFHIEIIVFKQNDITNELFDQRRSEINWPKRTAILSTTQYALSSLKQSPISFARVQFSDRLLNNTYASLKNSPNYQPLLHLSWVQSAGANRISDAVRIQSSSVNGIIRIQRGNYLHLLADIEYAPSQVIYHIQEKRRLKLNETHYMDHPKFGIIAKVTPL